jgi:hypothetical protein
MVSTPTVDLKPSLPSESKDLKDDKPPGVGATPSIGINIDKEDARVCFNPLSVFIMQHIFNPQVTKIGILGTQIPNYSVTDCRSLVKTLVSGVKTITWGTASCKAPGMGESVRLLHCFFILQSLFQMLPSPRTSSSCPRRCLSMFDLSSTLFKLLISTRLMSEQRVKLPSDQQRKDYGCKLFYLL